MKRGTVALSVALAVCSSTSHAADNKERRYFVGADAGVSPSLLPLARASFGFNNYAFNPPLGMNLSFGGVWDWRRNVAGVHYNLSAEIMSWIVRPTLSLGGTISGGVFDAWLGVGVVGAFFDDHLILRTEICLSGGQDKPIALTPNIGLGPHFSLGFRIPVSKKTVE